MVIEWTRVFWKTSIITFLWGANLSIKLFHKQHPEFEVHLAWENDLCQRSTFSRDLLLVKSQIYQPQQPKSIMSEFPASLQSACSWGGEWTRNYCRYNMYWLYPCSLWSPAWTLPPAWDLSSAEQQDWVHGKPLLSLPHSTGIFPGHQSIGFQN